MYRYTIKLLLNSVELCCSLYVSHYWSTREQKNEQQNNVLRQKKQSYETNNKTGINSLFYLSHETGKGSLKFLTVLMHPWGGGRVYTPKFYLWIKALPRVPNPLPFLTENNIGHFTVVYSVTQPMNVARSSVTVY